VFVFSSAFPFFNNVDEQNHVDLVMKYSRGYWPRERVERFDLAAGRLLVLYATFEYLSVPQRFAGGVFPRPLWERPGFEARVQEGAALWAQRFNEEAHAPPVYYALAGAWYTLGGWLGLADGHRLYWIRFLNVPLFAFLVWCTYLVCRDGYPGRLELRLGVPMLLAFLPQDVFYSVNSDVLSPPLFTASLLLLLRWYRSDEARTVLGAAVGLLVALTFLVKFTNIALPLIFGAALLLKTRQRLRDGRGRDALLAASVALFVAVLPVAICLGRNHVLFGDLTGTGPKLEHFGWSPRPLATVLAHPVFSPSGSWTFWDGLMRTFWRGEFVWHLTPIASPLVDTFYTMSSTVFLIAAAAAWAVRSRPGARARVAGAEAPTGVHATVWASVTLSVLCLAGLSVAFEYGPTSHYPSRDYPYFVSGRLIAGALVPFLILYVDGLAFLVRRLSRVGAPLVFVTSASVMMIASEVALTRHVFANPFNWFHLP